jgi:hypothetical protein
LLLSGFVALAVMAATSVAAQPFTEAAAARAIRDAGALSARIRGYHRWQGLGPPPAGYCATMVAGEAVVKELARLASRAILHRQPGLALRLQQAGDLLSDALDEEEMINQQADIPFTVYPCPAPPGPYPARAYVLAIIAQKMPACREEATVLGLSFAARRARMQQCLRIPGTQSARP